jgi:predicted nucleotidyltransferase
MGSLFSSHHAIEALFALEQRPEGLRLSEVSAVLAVLPSSAQKALNLLTGEGLVIADGHPRRRYAIAATEAEAVSLLLEFAGRRLPIERILAAVVRSSRAVEFAGLEPGRLLMVIRWDAEPRDEVRLNRALRRFSDRLAVERLDHETVRERLPDDPLLRVRAGRMTILAGSIDRTFPDPFAHGSPRAPLRRDLHPALRHPSRSALARVARRFGLREVRVFGSAIHEDFRADSDVDVMVRRQPGVRRTLEDEMALRRALEDLFERTVDVSDAEVLRPEVRQRAETDGVALYG